MDEEGGNGNRRMLVGGRLNYLVRSGYYLPSVPALSDAHPQRILVNKNVG